VQKRHNEELRDFYSSLILIGIQIKGDEISGACRTYLKINSYKVSTGKHEGKRPFFKTQNLIGMLTLNLMFNKYDGRA
jgi:hypothetical protein